MPPGTYPLTVTAIDGNLTNSSTVSLIVGPNRLGFTSVTESAAGLVLSGTAGGLTNLSCHVLATTNVALPLADWSVAGTATFDGAGNFSFTNPATPILNAQFFLLKVP